MRRASDKHEQANFIIHLQDRRRNCIALYDIRGSAA